MRGRVAAHMVDKFTIATYGRLLPKTTCLMGINMKEGSAYELADTAKI